MEFRKSALLNYFCAMAELWKTVYLGTGSNVGNRFANLQEALWLCDKRLGEVGAYSSIYETAAWGNTDQQAFLNQVIKIRTPFSPLQLMQKILCVEKSLGRKRELKWGPRTIDIDILFYDNQVLQKPDLVLPHPQLHLRKFVLVPLSEIAPGLIHPILKKEVSEILKNCQDPLEVKKHS